jgi:hypothetical protein
MEWSYKRFGETAALLYDALIKQAIQDISQDPERRGTK